MGQVTNFKGERMDFAAVSQEDFMIHLIRYNFAKDHLQGNVLDLACGVGYGSYYLSQQAHIASVKGCDISPVAIEHGRSRFTSPKLEYQVQDATKLSFADNSFDSQVSLETMEHIPRVEDYLKEIQRVLKPEATLVVSVPNIDFYLKAGWENEFHFNEMDYATFDATLAEYFEERTHFYQLMKPIDGLLTLRKLIRTFVPKAAFDWAKGLVHQATYDKQVERGFFKNYGYDFQRFLDENPDLAEAFKIVSLSDPAWSDIHKKQIGNHIAICKGLKKP